MNTLSLSALNSSHFEEVLGKIIDRLDSWGMGPGDQLVLLCIPIPVMLGILIGVVLHYADHSPVQPILPLRETPEPIRTLPRAA